MVRWKKLLLCAVLAGFIFLRADAVTLTWTGAGNGNWSSAGNWSPSNAPSSGDILLFDGTGTSTSNVDVNLDFTAVSFTGLTSDFTLSTSNASVITIDASDNLSFANAQIVTINVKIDGSGGVTMSNSGETGGTVILNAANQYFGPTLVNYGTLKDGQAGSYSPQSQFDVGASGTLDVNYDETVGNLLNGTGGGGSVVIASGATLNVSASSSFGGIISGAGGLEISNDADFNVQANYSYTGATTIDAGSQLSINDGTSLSPMSTITGLGTLGFENVAPLNFDNYITGEMNVLQEQSGTTTLYASNDYSGFTTITNGVLTDGADNVFSPNSTVRIGTGATLDIEHSETIPEISSYFTNSGTIDIGPSGTLNLTSDSINVNAVLIGSGNLNINEGAQLSLTGTTANTFTGNISLNSGGYLGIGDGGLGAASVSGNGSGMVQLVNDMPITIGADLGESSEDSLQLTLTGNAKATLNPYTSNVYEGDTRIDGVGTLADGKDNSFSPNSVVNIDLGGTLEADFNETIAGLNDGGMGGGEHVTIAAGKTLTLFLTDNQGGQSFLGDISGAGALKVDGDGSTTQVLSGENSYTGGTTIGNSVLDLSGGVIDHPAANLVVGNNNGDNGWLIIENGATMTNLDAMVGNTPGTTGLVQVLGGSWTTLGSLTVGNGGDGTIDLVNGGTINIGGGSGTLTLGSASSGAALIIGEDDNHFVDPNSGGILNAAAIVGSAPTIGFDNLIFSPNGSPESPYYFTKTGTNIGTPVEIDGTIHVAINGPVVLSNANSTYSGGTTVTDNNLLFLGASTSGGSPDSPAMGPIGVGALTLGIDSNLDLTQSNVTLANTLYLSSDDESIDTFGNSSNPDNLTLTGTITGKAQILWAGSGTLTLSNAGSYFGGGVEIGEGTLNVTASTTGGSAMTAPTFGPAGTGIIYLDDATTLTRPNGADITLTNSIRIVNEGSQAYITGDPTGLFTLGGTLTDEDGTGRLNISSPVDLTGNDLIARTYVTGTTLTVEADGGAAGTDLFGLTGAILDFPTASPTLEAMTLQNSTANFTGGTNGSPELEGLSLTNSTINFADNSNPQIWALQDSMGSTNVLHLGGSGSDLIFDSVGSGSPITYYGAITGTGNVDIGGVDTLTVTQLYGNNTFSGHTTIEGTNLGVAGSNNAFSTGVVYLAAGSALVVNSGVTLSNQTVVQGDGIFIGGAGTFAPTSTPTLTIQNASVIAGGTGALGEPYGNGSITGNAVGTLTVASTTNVTFSGGGILQFSVMNDTGTAGTDFSTINVNGTFTIDSSTATDKFVIQLVGIQAPGSYDFTANSPLSFDFNSPHSWTLLTAGTIVNPGGVFDPTDFQVDTMTDFSGPGTGMWSVSESGNLLQLNFTPVPEPSTWALLAGGFGVLGFVAWRRRPAKVA